MVGVRVEFELKSIGEFAFGDLRLGKPRTEKMFRNNCCSLPEKSHYIDSCHTTCVCVCAITFKVVIEF
jgi:hypothetical protein